MQAGNGPIPVLFLPGIMGTWKSDFGPQLEEDFDGSRYTMVSWDPPGYGKSRPFDREPSEERYYNDGDIVDKLMQVSNCNTYVYAMIYHLVSVKTVFV